MPNGCTSVQCTDVVACIHMHTSHLTRLRTDPLIHLSFRRIITTAMCQCGGAPCTAEATTPVQAALLIWRAFQWGGFPQPTTSRTQGGQLSPNCCRPLSHVSTTSSAYCYGHVVSSNGLGELSLPFTLPSDAAYDWNCFGCCKVEKILCRIGRSRFRILDTPRFRSLLYDDCADCCEGSAISVPHPFIFVSRVHCSVVLRSSLQEFETADCFKACYTETMKMLPTQLCMGHSVSCEALPLMVPYTQQGWSCAPFRGNNAWLLATGSHGGTNVEVEGSFDNWTTRQTLQRAGKDFTIVKLLPPGVYQVWDGSACCIGHTLCAVIFA